MYQGPRRCRRPVYPVLMRREVNALGFISLRLCYESQATFEGHLAILRIKLYRF